jgi:type IV secretory pathway TraG/TraD family ATPase VirD4
MNELRTNDWSRFFGVTCFISLLICIVIMPVLTSVLGIQCEIAALLIYLFDYLTCFAFYSSCSSFSFELSTSLNFVLYVTVMMPIVSLMISTFILKSYKAPPLHRHLAGPLVLSGRKAICHAKQEQKKESGPRGLYLHPKIQISRKRELGNFFIFGQQGAGKSTIIKLLLDQLLKRGDSLFIYDEKREYIEQYFTGTEVLLCPGDRRSVCWDISKDVTDDASAKTVANVLIQSSTQDKFWTDAAQSVLTGMLIVLMKKGRSWGWQELNSLVFSEAQTLHDLFELHYKAGLNLVEPDSKTTLSILTTLSIQLSWLPDLAAQWKNCTTGFSLKNWQSAQNSNRIFVAGNPMCYEMSAAICSALLSLLAKKIIASPDSDSRRFWFVLDELGNMPKTESLKKLLTLGRSKGVRTIAGTQAVSQLRSIYGQDDAETILSLFSNVIALRTGPIGDSAKVASESLGTKRVEQRVKSFDSSGKKSINFQHSEMPVVNTEEIIHLPRSNCSVSGYLLINGYESVYRLDWPIQKRLKIAEAFIPMEEKLVDSNYSASIKSESKNRLRRGRKAS